MSYEQLLVTEQAFYDRSASRLLAEYPNRYLLIHGENLLGAFESQDEAVRHGVQQFGREPFLVRRSGDKQTRFAVPALTLGVLCQS